ncbi:MAG TPA: threonine synthase [Gammaproteobacteria bacterium]|jgi:threonine synthase|nr:threonine synthase [Gammaproteobacteria bacterium]
MRYSSTRGGGETDLVDAVMRGLAKDGGLFVPDELPRFSAKDFRGETLAEISTELLTPFFAGSGLESELAAICRDAFDFPVPLRPLIEAQGQLSVLELFHGPTAAFKDVGARFLAAVMERALPRFADRRPLTILVATSGDTGGAVAAAFHRRKGIRVGVLFPKGQVSPRQQHQLTCWGDNIRAFEVEGSFDDCQALVKAAFQDADTSRHHRLSAANSINIGRLLPQACYHAAASLWHWRRHGTSASSIVPTGNLGNGMACVWARAMGLPIGEIVLAVNANRTIPDFLATGQWQPRPSTPTLASAMDVGNPSNMERLRALLPDFGELRSAVEAYPVDDDAIRAQIAKDYGRYGQVWCPHTATAFWVYDHLPAARRVGHPWIVSATAHPAKFESIVEPVIGRAVPVPPALAELLQRPTASTPLKPELPRLVSELDAWK